MNNYQDVKQVAGKWFTTWRMPVDNLTIDRVQNEKPYIVYLWDEWELLSATSTNTLKCFLEDVEVSYPGTTHVSWKFVLGKTQEQIDRLVYRINSKCGLLEWWQLNKTAMTNYFNDILKSYRIDEEVSEDDFDLLMSFFAYHPEADEKLAGVYSIYRGVNVHTEYRKRMNPCFCLRKVDGTVDDIAIRACAEGYLSCFSIKE